MYRLFLICNTPRQFVRVTFSLTMASPSMSTNYDDMLHTNEVGRSMVQTVSRGSHTEEVRFQSEARPCGKFGVKSGGTKTDFSFVSFSLSVSMHQRSLLIHSSTTNAI